VSQRTVKRITGAYSYRPVVKTAVPNPLIGECYEPYDNGYNLYRQLFKLPQNLLSNRHDALFDDGRKTRGAGALPLDA
jgi:hypothetical protein